jgi:DNA-binding transcriptional ArsR family regulator
MGWWQMDTDTLAGGRFVISPLAETVAALCTLERGLPAHPGERAWLDTHLPAYRERLTAEPLTAALVRIGLGGSWNADFMTPTPAGEGERGFDSELEAVLATPAATAHADLAVCLGGGPLPAALRAIDAAERAARLYSWVWTRTVEPSWQARRRVLEADIVARAGTLASGGWAAVLDSMRPGMRWLGEGRLQINTHDKPPRTTAGTLLFVPVTPRHGWVSWSGDRFALVHPCTGALAHRDAAAPAALGRLIGGPRAAVLVLLAAPKSTTQLVALTGQGLGSVGRHLRVLLDAGLVRRRRAGRAVLYFRTAAGDALVEAQRT